MRSALRTIVVSAIAMAMIGGWLWANGDGIDEQRGTQIRSPAVSIGDAESHPWSVLANEAGLSSPEFPRPLIAQDTRVCFGFERLDFGMPARPSLARCVEREALRSLSENGIASIFVIKAGLDTWHVIASGAPVDAIDIVGADNAKVSAERIFIGDGVVAMRLPNDLRIKSVFWTRGRSRYRCDPPADAVHSGNFCT
jgi:hypothetical protein